ncbi:MAG TPA: amidohydrolase family protein [Rhodospirillales bacterium]|nr:amidohydrolase family protein [Rhodospirillales bacterium]HJO69462.1 amidohydrolase family protein [Rhodospirillales bacterium]
MHPHASVDIHAHFFPASFLDLVADEGTSYGAALAASGKEGAAVLSVDGTAWPLESRIVDLEQRLAAMDEQGVDVHALSLTAPMVYWADPKLALKLSQAFNDAVVEAHQHHPDRFVSFAMLPMNDPALAARELERIAAAPGVRGLYMATRIRERELSDDAFSGVFERAEALGLPIFLHPIKVVEPERLKSFYLTNLVGNPTESAIAAAHLIFGGVLDRFPKLTVCLPHAGGSFPYLVGRINHGWEVRPECAHLERGPVEYLRRFYYDTVSHSAKALAYLIDLVGADRVMLGSDYCFDMGYERPVEVVGEHPGLSADDKRRILGDNARALLGLG